MQMSAARVFVFIEGWTDRSFYDGLSLSVCRPAGVEFEIRTAEEIEGESGGKEKLLALFETLDDSGALIETFEGKTTAALFFLDKDIDDFLGRLVTSEHICYTEHYHAENYWFKNGDLVRACVAATDLDTATIGGAIPSPEAWRRQAAEEWKDWVKLCVHAHAYNLDCGCKYSAPSRVNDRCYGGVVARSVAQRLADLKSVAGLPDTEFNERHVAVCRWVDGLYAQGKYDSVFRGKWYVYFLAATVKAAAGARGWNRRPGLEGRLTSTLLATLDFDAAWTGNLRAPLEALVVAV